MTAITTFPVQRTVQNVGCSLQCSLLRCSNGALCSVQNVGCYLHCSQCWVLFALFKMLDAISVALFKWCSPSILCCLSDNSRSLANFLKPVKGRVKFGSSSSYTQKSLRILFFSLNNLKYLCIFIFKQ